MFKGNAVVSDKLTGLVLKDQIAQEIPVFRLAVNRLSIKADAYKRNITYEINGISRQQNRSKAAKQIVNRIISAVQLPPTSQHMKHAYQLIEALSILGLKPRGVELLLYALQRNDFLKGTPPVKQVPVDVGDFSTEYQPEGNRFIGSLCCAK